MVILIGDVLTAISFLEEAQMREWLIIPGDLLWRSRSPRVTKKEKHARKGNSSEARHLLQLFGVTKAFKFTDGIFLNKSSVDMGLQILLIDRPTMSHWRYNREKLIGQNGYGCGSRKNCVPLPVSF